MRLGMDFYYKYATTTVDVDGYYGAQCWDLYAQYCKDNDVPYANCTTTGYVKDIYTNRKSNGMNKYWDEVDVMKCGDWAVFDVADLTPYSHIAMFIEDVDGKRGRFFGQNQSSTLITLPYDTILGAFRLKTNEWKPSIPSKGTVKAMYNQIIVRSEPNTKKGNTGLWYNKGMTLNYDSIIHKNGRYWLSYVNGDGKRRYISYAKEDGTEIWWR